jgi:hypothetical protein
MKPFFVHFFRTIDSHIFTNNSNNITFYGLDTNEAILQICGNNTLFAIKHKIDVKTEDNQNNNKLIECMEKSHKKLVMKTLFLESK